MSPLVDFTSKTPSPTSRIETSNVPPPRSYTAMVPLSFLSRPYANAAAVGSLIIQKKLKTQKLKIKKLMKSNNDNLIFHNLVNTTT